MDIKLTGGRIIDPKDWAGWAWHSPQPQLGMVRHLTSQAEKYLTNPGYTLEFEFKKSIPEPVLKALTELRETYGERLT